MKLVFKLLAAACLLLGLAGTVIDLVEGNFGEDTVTVLIVAVLAAGVFGYLAWLWRGKSPVKRAAEQAGQIAEDLRYRREEERKMSAVLKRRMWKYRIAGGALVLLAVWMFMNWAHSNLRIGLTTVVLIAGIAVWALGSPGDYNASTDMMTMIGMDRPRKLEEFYEAFKSVKTPFGSGWLGRFSTMKQPALIFGPNYRGDYLYFWLGSKGNIGYLGYLNYSMFKEMEKGNPKGPLGTVSGHFLDGIIKERINEPLYPAQEPGADLAGHLCYSSDALMFQQQLKDCIDQFAKTGHVPPIRESLPSQVYTFTEQFKLTGQRFEVMNAEKQPVLRVEGTVPLMTLRVLDTKDEEIFRMTKEIGHALATYRFYYKGEPYGTLEKQFTLIRDKFAMDVTEGRLELREYAGTIGHDFSVTLNGRMLGAIMDNMDITIGNLVFDNSFLIVYEEKYLPLLTAMAVMVARELARDEDGGVSNRI